MSLLKPAGEIVAFAYLAANGERKLVAFEIDPLAPDADAQRRMVVDAYERVAKFAAHLSPLVGYTPEPVPLATIADGGKKTT